MTGTLLGSGDKTGSYKQIQVLQSLHSNERGRSFSWAQINELIIN